MKILSSFTHTKVVPNLPYYGKKNTIWKSKATSNYLVINILENIFCVQQKIDTHTGLEKLEGE